MKFPNDADGDALRRLVKAGSDLARPMTIDFTVDVPTRAAGQAIAWAAQKVGYHPSVEYDEESGAWTCYCSRHMIADYRAVVAAQEELNRLSELHGGFCDGWGSFGNATAC
jgi:hypothetical protein